MTKVLVWQDKEKRRRMFDGIQWVDVEAGEIAIMIIGRDLDTKMLTALGVAGSITEEAE